MGQENNLERIRFDQITKKVFTVSDKVLIKCINGLFQQSFDIEKTKVIAINPEFIKADFSDIHSDAVFRIEIDGRKEYFHLEFQVKKDDMMAIRLVEYGFFIGKDYGEDGNYSQLVIPDQRVIYFEENNSIGDAVNVDLVHRRKVVYSYEVPVIKNWELTPEEIVAKEIYPLLPLQLFNYRSKLESAYKKDQWDKLKHLGEDFIISLAELLGIAKKLMLQNVLNEKDLQQLVDGMRFVYGQYEQNYLKKLNLSERVSEMTQLVFDESLIEKGIEKGIIKTANRMIAKGWSVEDIVDATDLSEDIIQKLYENYCAENAEKSPTVQ